MRKFGLALVASMMFAAPAVAADAAPQPIEVMIVGTFHFDNPGQDIANLQVDDVLASKRQGEIADILAGLQRFSPTKIAVESQRRQAGTWLSETYPKFLNGDQPVSRSEVVQLGFRLAQRLRLKEVYAVDVDGDFPFDKVMEFAGRTGRSDEVQAKITAIQSDIAKESELLKTGTLGALLRAHNDPKWLDEGQKFYLDMLSFGAAEDQPGVKLVSSWYERNLKICAAVVQAAKPGDRIAVFYGSGHAYYLRQCFGNMTNFKLVEANEYLPK